MDRIPCAPYPELQLTLKEFVGGVQAALAANFAGAYLVGSLATGDFDADSDVDFMVLTSHELTAGEVQSLQALHSHVYAQGCYPAQHLEGSYISIDLLNRSDLVGVAPLWYVDNGSTVLERSTHDNQWHVRWILRERAITLAGPDPKALMQCPSAHSLRAEMVAAMHKLADHFVAEIDQPLAYFNTRFGQSFAVLTCCRILHTLQSGAVHSKRAGVQWAMNALDGAWHGLIQQAWNEREGVRFGEKIRQSADESALSNTAEFLKFGISECARRS